MDGYAESISILAHTYDKITVDLVQTVTPRMMDLVETVTPRMTNIY